MDEEQTTRISEQAQPPDALSALLANPQLLSRIGELLGGARSAPAEKEESAPVEGAAAQTSATASSPPIDGLGAILSDPAMLERLPQIIAVMKPLLGAIPPTEQKAPPTVSITESPALCREHLLLALKPFLSPGRRDAVDSILRISKLGAVFKQLK